MNRPFLPSLYRSSICSLLGKAGQDYGSNMDAPYHPPLKRSIEIAGHKTSISLEPLFWDMLRDAAAKQGEPINALVAQIDAERLEAENPPGLASAIRVWIVMRLMNESS